MTGPDEYNVLVDNNFYTNLMARENLRDAVRAVEYLKEHAPEDLKRLEEKLDFSVKELELWREIIEKCTSHTMRSVRFIRWTMAL